MIKHTIEISGLDTALSVGFSQLEVRRGDAVLGKIPIEDVGLLIVDTLSAQYSHQAVIRILDLGGAVLFCDGKHMPAGLLLPMDANSLQCRRMRFQSSASQPLQKRLWQQIVRQKITNQGCLLAELDLDGADAVKAMARGVRSGDPANIEAQASRRYWPALFGKEFRRSREGAPPNGLLNYGYACIRATVARALAGTGLNPSLGIHHSNQYNTFALADDLFEPLRPLVDRATYRLKRDGLLEVTPETKRAMLSLLAGQTAESSNFTGPLLVALERYAASLCQCYCGEAEHLEIPKLWI